MVQLGDGRIPCGQRDALRDAHPMKAASSKQSDLAKANTGEKQTLNACLC